MPPQEDFHVTGRGLKRGRIILTASEAGALVEVHDDENPEFWVYVRISRDKLRELLASVDAHNSAAGNYFNNGKRSPIIGAAAVELPDIPPFEPPLPDIPPSTN